MNSFYSDGNYWLGVATFPVLFVLYKVFSYFLVFFENMINGWRRIKATYPVWIESCVNNGNCIILKRANNDHLAVLPISNSRYRLFASGISETVFGDALAMEFFVNEKEWLGPFYVKYEVADKIRNLLKAV